jgi:hypothetical protein
MGRTTIPWEDVLEPDDRPPLEYAEDTGWRAFLGSWKWGAILALGCVLGVIAIVSAKPFGSASVSERVSDKVGQTSSCTEVGAAQLAGVHSTIYRCTVGISLQSVVRCFAISGSDIRQLSGRRDLHC